MGLHPVQGVPCLLPWNRLEWSWVCKEVQIDLWMTKTHLLLGCVRVIPFWQGIYLSLNDSEWVPYRETQFTMKFSSIGKRIVNEKDSTKKQIVCLFKPPRSFTVQTLLPWMCAQFQQKVCQPLHHQMKWCLWEGCSKAHLRVNHAWQKNSHSLFVHNITDHQPWLNRAEKSDILELSRKIWDQVDHFTLLLASWQA